MAEGDRGNLWLGLLLGVAANAAGCVLLFALIDGIGFYPFVGFGAVQLVWMLPIILAFRKRGAMEMAKGVAVAGGITFLLWSACVGLLFSGAIRIGG
jgi:hypothetical protein